MPLGTRNRPHLELSNGSSCSYSVWRPKSNPAEPASTSDLKHNQVRLNRSECRTKMIHRLAH